ncbi:MAG: hypothetical protein KGS61_17015, partial [Verrucomicrobia bacterium]|nr:hypothetical protein [Verrucomicrobiota bacterium]
MVVANLCTAFGLLANSPVPNPAASPLAAPSGVRYIQSGQLLTRPNAGPPAGMSTNASIATVGIVDPSPGGIGPNYRRWISVPTASTTTGQTQLSAGTNRPPFARHIVEIATGMSRWNGQQWVPSDPTFTVAGNAFIADRLQYSVRLAADLNVAQAVTVTTRDGVAIRSTPAAIGLYDAASGRSAIVAQLADCAGVLVSSNQVLYANAFNTNGVHADVLYTTHRGSFAQDVIFRGRLDPADYGFPTNSTRIQVITELYSAPQPDRIERPIRVEQDQATRNRMATPDLVDQILGFGEFVLATGRATVAGKVESLEAPAAPVVKEIVTSGQRQFLVESVEYPSVQGQLQALPKLTAAAPKPHPWAASLRVAAFPAPRPERPLLQLAPATAPVTVAWAHRSKAAGLVIDYLATIGGSLSGTIVFQGDTTYFVSAPVYCNGPVTVEGGAVFKYPNSTGANPVTTFIQLNNSLTSKTKSYHPAVFTAGDDDSVGDSLGNTDTVVQYGNFGYITAYSSSVFANYSGSTANKYYANPALILYYLSSSALSNLRFCYCQEAVLFAGGSGYSGSLTDSQLVNCMRGIAITGSGSGSGGSGMYVTVRNSLMSSVQNPLAVYATSYGNALYNCTVDHAAQVVSDSYSAPSSISAKNCIFSNDTYIGDEYTSVSGSYNGFYSSPQFGSSQLVATQSPFQAVGSGAYYLSASSGFCQVGTTAIDSATLNDIQTKTTQPPMLLLYPTTISGDTTWIPLARRDSGGNPDLGYHYDPLDYLVNGILINQATLSLVGGCAVGFIALPNPANSTIYAIGAEF